ncbi:hypothetical protein [Salinimonas chungwhensis]|uniref:hypothetical protein n=1 Tax=Salinimonas chungwhensis TaxID=265425 RepID=UPI00036F16E5|nr:hypothetical protein [Salinimonas chungwhensis]
MSELILDANFDRLCMTSVVDEISYQKYSENINNISYLLAAKNNIKMKRVGWQSERYLNNIRLPLLSRFIFGERNPETPHLLVQVSEKHCRFEFKGHPLNYKHYLCARQWIAIITGEHISKCFDPKRMTVTATDIAIDLKAAISSLTVDQRRSQKSGAFYNRAGGLETLYTGMSRSSKRTVLYDRSAKALDAGLTPYDKMITRVEIRLKNRMKLDSFMESVDLNKIYGSIYLYSLDEIVESEMLPETYLSLIKTIGIKPILQSMNDSERRRFRKKIEPFEVDILSCKEIEVALRTAINNISYLFEGSQLIKSRYRDLKKQFKKEYGFTRL